MEITAVTENRNYIIQIHGDVDASSSIHVDQEVRKAMEEKVDHILIDCAGLNYISSAGLGVFMSYIQELKQKSIRLSLYGMSEKVFKVFEILGLHNIMTIVANKEEALAG